VVSTLARLDPRGFSRRNVDSIWWHWLVNRIAASPAFDRSSRARLLRRAGIELGSALVDSGCFFFGADVCLGEASLINHRCYFDSRDRIEVGSHCSLAMEVMLCTSTHELGDRVKRAGPYTTGPIAIGEGTWIGARAIVLPNVTIGPGCVIAAGAVVAEDAEPHGLYAGVPARRVRDL
jgi:maltose O-acetyltransferase